MSLDELFPRDWPKNKPKEPYPSAAKAKVSPKSAEKVHMADISFSVTPQFTDHCKHIGPGVDYHGSVCVDGDWHDVYSYDGGFEGRTACFRYGEEPSEYISPGGIAQAIVRHHEAVNSKTYGQTITSEQLAHHLAVYRECLKLIQPESFEGTSDGQE